MWGGGVIICSLGHISKDSELNTFLSKQHPKKVGELSFIGYSKVAKIFLFFIHPTLG